MGLLFGDLPLEAQRAVGKHFVPRLQKERVKSADAVNRAQSIHTDAQRNLATQGIAGNAHRLQVRPEDALFPIVGMADQMPAPHPFSG